MNKQSRKYCEACWLADADNNSVKLYCHGVRHDGFYGFTGWIWQGDRGQQIKHGCACISALQCQRGHFYVLDHLDFSMNVCVDEASLFCAGKRTEDNTPVNLLMKWADC